MSAFLSKYGVARDFYIPMIKRAVIDFAVGADWTPAAGDVKISKDGGAAANVTNLPTALAMGNTAMWKFTVTATEMEAAQIKITVADAATKAVEDNMFICETYGHASAQHAADLDDATALGLSRLDAAVSTRFASASAPANFSAMAITGGGAVTAGTVSDKTGYELSATGIDAIIDDAVAEPTARPTWASMTLRKIIAWLGVLMLNRINETSASQAIRNDANSADLATHALSDDGTTLVRDKGV